MRRKWAPFAVCAALFAIAVLTPCQQQPSATLGQKGSAGGASTSSTSSSGNDGLLLLKSGHYTAAIPLLQKSVELHPDSWKYSLALAEALLASNHNFTALGFLQKVKPHFGARQEYRYALALAYYLCYQYQAAIREFGTLPQDDPRFNRIPFLIGNCYMASGDLKQAEKYFRLAIKLAPGEATYYVSLAKMLRMQGRLGEAAAALNKALALDPQNAEARLHLASCEEGQGDYQSAFDQLQQLIRQRPDYQPARLAFASIYEHRHEWAKAREQRQIAARLKPPRPVRNPELGPVASSLARQ